MQVTTSIRSMMVHAANEIQGKVHTAAKEIVVHGYELMLMSLTGDSNAIIADMVKHQLDNSNYIHGYYKAVSIHSHTVCFWLYTDVLSYQHNREEFHDMPFCNPCIRDLIWHLWFRSRPSGTILWILNPIPSPLIAFACAALKCALDEWATGSFEKTVFSQHNYRQTYINHHAAWQSFEQGNYKNHCCIIASSITHYCMKMSGVKVGMAENGVD